MLTIIVAAAGWALFLGMAALYTAGNRLNARESNALAAYSLAILLSDGYRSGLAASFVRAAKEKRSDESNASAIAYALMQGVTQSALRCYQYTDDLNSVAVATAAIQRLEA